jgi:hypothetical protein
LIEEELCYDTNNLLDHTNNLLDQSKLLISHFNIDELNAFNTIVSTVLLEAPSFYILFLDMEPPEKTFLWNAIVTHLQAQKKIVLIMAFSGVARPLPYCITQQSLNYTS